MIKSLFSTGWRRLAVVLLVVWEIYWFVEWRRVHAEADRLASEAYNAPIYPISNPAFDAAYAASGQALNILIASPVIALSMFLAGKWVGAGFRAKRG